MFDQPTIANNVSRWTGLGVKLPKELASAINVFETLLYTEVGHQPVFEVTEVTPANAEEKIRQFADQLAVSEVPGGGLSVLGKAKKHAVDAAARRVNALARHAVPDVIDQLTPEFSEHAAAYTEAVSQLPDDLTAETLLAAGPEAVAAYGEAKREAAYLNRISGWVFETAYLSGVIPKDAEPVLRILRPSSALELIELDGTSHRPADSTVAALNPVWITAARHGVEFGINTLREAADLRIELSAISTVGSTLR